MRGVVRAWARIAERHLFTIFLLKLLLGSLLFIGLLSIIGDFGRGCRKLEEVEYLLEECSLKRLKLERQEGQKAENGSGIVKQLKLCKRKMERQGIKLEEAEVRMADNFLLLQKKKIQIKTQIQIQIKGENGGHKEGVWSKGCPTSCQGGTGATHSQLSWYELIIINYSIIKL